MDRVGNSQTDNAINLAMDSNSKTGTSSTAMNVSEAQSAFGGKSHEARPQECFLTKPSQRTVKTIGAESNQSCDQLKPTLKNALVLYNAGYDSHQSCDQLEPTSNNALAPTSNNALVPTLNNALEPTLNNALVLYTGEQSCASVLTLQNPDAERILLIEKINDTVEWQNWEKLNTLLNSEISSDLTERELMNVYEKIYVQEGLKCSGISQANAIFFFIVGQDQPALLKLFIKIDFFAYFCELRKDTFYPLNVAMQSGRINIVKLLLVYLSPHVCTSKDETLRYDSLVCAVKVGDVKSARSLIIAGVKVNYSDKSLPLDIAMDTCNPEMIMLLLDVGKADPNKWKVTPPLLRALAKNDVRCTELLLRAGATVNYDSDTADDSYLVSFLKASRVHLVECLIVKGAILHSKHAEAYRKLLSDNGYDNKNTPLRLLALSARIVSTSLYFCSSTKQRIEVVNKLEIPIPLQQLLHFGVEHQGAIIDGKAVTTRLYQR